MKEEAKGIWLVRDSCGPRAVNQAPGEVDRPWNVLAMYATKEDCAKYIPASRELFAEPPPQPDLYDDVFAWYVMAYISGGGDLSRQCVQGSRGGPIRNTGDDEVRAVFFTREEAEQWLLDHGGESGYEKRQLPLL